MPEQNSDLRIRLDPLNPGHFFACCGLFELVRLDQSEALASFEMSGSHPREATFVVHGAGGDDKLRNILGTLRLGKPEFPEDSEVEATVRPADIALSNQALRLDWWLREFYTDGTCSLKCWAGQVTSRNLFESLLPLLDDSATGFDLFERARMSKAKFGVDPRSAWNSLDFGYSPNEHGSDSATYPAVEILAAVGLQFFRPDYRDRKRVEYSIWKTPLPAAVARQAFRSPWKGLPVDNLRFSIQSRGQSYKYFSFATREQRREER